MEALTQKLKLTTANTGSITNWLMSNNNTMPKPGEGATICLYSDRHAYTVIDVSSDGKRIKMKRCKSTRTDSRGMADSQDYDYSEHYDHTEEYVYRTGAWRQVIKKIVFVAYDSLTKEQRNEAFCQETGELKLIPGITKVKASYNKTNILFGIRDEHYDYTR